MVVLRLLECWDSKTAVADRLQLPLSIVEGGQ